MAVNVDPGVQAVIDNMQVIVGSEGGSVEILEFDEGKLRVKYHKGVNEECPECVPDHALVEMMVKSSLGTYAPHVTNFELI